MKNILILGIQGNLGSEIAENFISQGYSIFGTYHKAMPDKYIGKENIRLLQLSLGDIESTSRFLEEISAVNFDVVVNTVANTLTFNRFQDTPLECFEKDLDVNVISYITILQKIIPNLNEGANVISILTQMTIGEPPSYFSSYVSSKYFILGLTKSLANEFKNKGIRFNAVSPGMMDTKFISGLPDQVKKNYLYDSKNFTDPKKVVEAINKIISSSISGGNVLVK